MHKRPSAKTAENCYYFDVKRTLILVLGVLSLSFVVPTTVLACSCAAGAQDAESLRKVNAVFEGHIVAVDTHYFFPFGVMGYDALYKVTRSWKGVDTKYVRVSTGVGSGDCGVQFDVSSMDTVVVSGISDGYRGLEQNICTPNSTVTLATEAFGPGTTDLRNNWYLAYVPSVWPAYATAVGLGAVVLFFVWLRHRRTSKPPTDRKVV